MTSFCIFIGQNLPRFVMQIRLSCDYKERGMEEIFKEYIILFLEQCDVDQLRDVYAYLIEILKGSGD